jgi:predicted Rossmann-fold nucleotide-binding protein
MGDYRPGDAESYRATIDGRIYDHFENSGRARPPSILEDLARRLHDHAVTDALHEHLAGRRVVAIMGGHGLSRTDDTYRDVAVIARTLTESGFTLASGGGPGAMEATHLGASLAGRGAPDLGRALTVLARAPRFEPVGAWLDTAFEVWRDLPDAAGATHVGIPTWLYGHEPPTVFAPNIAKFFRNSLREEGLVTLAEYGILFAPGSAGTVQEIFQDATQNHYHTEPWISPMVFLGREYWTERLPVLPLLRALAGERPYAELVTVTDDPVEAIRTIETFEPSV